MDFYLYATIATTILIFIAHIALGEIELENITGAILSGFIWPVFAFLALGFVILYIMSKFETPNNLG